jgi:hypothetical protein
VSRLGRQYTPDALPAQIVSKAVDGRMEDLVKKITALSLKYKTDEGFKEVDKKVTGLHTLVTQEMYFSPTTAFHGWGMKAGEEDAGALDARGRLKSSVDGVKGEIRGIKALCLSKRNFPSAIAGAKELV